MTKRSMIQRVAVVGAGSVGLYFGGMLARAKVPVTLIARPDHVHTINEKGLRMECQTFSETVKIDASSAMEAIRSADLVLICVKSPDSVKVAEDIAPHLSENAILLSLQNGIDNAQRMQHQFVSPVYSAVVYVACQVPGVGKVRHLGGGYLTIGSTAMQTLDRSTSTRSKIDLLKIQSCFTKAAVDVHIADDVNHALWSKFIINCAFNGMHYIHYTHYIRYTHYTHHKYYKHYTLYTLYIPQLGVMIASKTLDQANKKRCTG